MPAKRNVFVLATLLCGLMVGCGEHAAPNDLLEQPDLGPTLVPGITALSGTEPSADEATALAPLDRLTADATIVGLGESLHTVDGMQRMRMRFMRRLVEHGGFRLIAIEWQPRSGETVEAYLQKGTGSATAAARTLSVWASTSTAEFLEWARAFNVAHPSDPIHFIGIDAQQGVTDMNAVRAFLLDAAPADASALTAGLASCDNDPTHTAFMGDLPKCLEALDSISAFFSAHEASIVAATSAARLELNRIALMSARAFEQEMASISTDITASYAVRDEAMGARFLRTRALLYPMAKTIFWAHNYHLRKAGALVTGTNAIGAVTAGTRVAEGFGAGYKVVAIVAKNLGIDWPNVGCGAYLTVTLPTSVENVLDALGPAASFADLTQATTVFPPGIAFDEQDAEHATPREQYDAIAYLRDAAKITPLAWPDCSP